jgi:hypothetical protein
MKHIRALSMVAATSLFVGACGSGDPFEAAGIDPLGNAEKYVEAYFLKDNPVVPQSDKVKVFIDFSDGMYYAYQTNRENVEMLNAVAHKLIKPATISWYRLGSGNIKPLHDTQTELFNRVTSPKSYSQEIMAPIEGTLKQITSSNSEALLVTDFEEYTPNRQEQFENYAKPYFIEWLKKGNSIHFFITNYTENKQVKHLFFTVFSTPQKKLLKDIRDAWEGRFRPLSFTLSTDFYTITNEYGASQKGGNYYDDLGDDIVGSLDAGKYINGLKKNNNKYEYYPFQQDWSNMLKNAQALMEPGVPKPFTDFFRKLYIDVSNEDAFTLKRLELKVTDVTADFDFYAKTEELKKHKPTLEKDTNGNSTFAETETDPIALACYDPNNGEILPEWRYLQQAFAPLNEVFTLNQELYNNGYKDNKKHIEIGINFDPLFDPSQVASSNGILRVELVIAETAPNLSRLDGLFAWNSITQAGRKNSSLSESVRNTLQEVNPQNKVIYTYFVQTIY